MTLRIGHKLLLATLVTSSLAVTVACVAFLGYERTSLQRAMETDLQVLADVVGDHGTAALTFGDRDGATGGLASLQAHPHVTGAVLFDAKGVPFATYHRESVNAPATPEHKPSAALDWQPDGLAVTRLIMLDGAAIGSVYMRTDLGELRERMRHQTEVMGLAMLAAGILALVLGALLQWRIARRIRQLAELSCELNEAYGGTEPRGRDEIARVAAGLHTLTKRLAERHTVAPQPSAVKDGARATLERERDEALVAARRSSEYLAFMSHELRTPLTGMIGMTDLALEGTLAPEQREYLTHARASADQLMAVVNDVLDLSKLEAERVELEHTPFALRETLASALRTLTPRAHSKGLELVVQVADDLPDTVLGDPVRLQQVLVNLLGNAVKFTAHGGITLTVAGAPTTDGSLELQVDVRDTGIGIAPERIEQLFEPYTQAERSTTREYGGTGLGLNICRHLVGLMGGHLWAESMPGEGSTFHFTLRLGTTVDAHVLPTALPVAGGAALVVDDHEGARTLLASELQSLGLHVTTASDGPAALAEIAQAEAAGSHFDLVFVDHAMPGMDGATLIAALRLHPQVPGVTVLMVAPGSALGEPSHDTLSGIAARISKPLVPAQVREVVVQVLGLAAAGAPVAADVATTRALEVLVAEDDPVNRKLAVTLLHKHGHRVTVANDGREACAWLDRRMFDLVLMDMHMPDVDGFAATEAIRAHEAETGARRTPIIALTALATDEDRARGLAVGMDGHTHKPLRMVELMAEYGHLFLPAVAASVAPPLPRPATSMPTEPARRPAYDRAQLERNVDGDLGLMRELVDAFVVSHGEQVNALQSALSERRVAEALRAAHSLKGMLLTLAAGESAQVAYDMELSLRAHEVEHAVARMPELAVELERLVIDLGGDERRAA